MNKSRSERQAALLALLAMIKQAAPRDRPALRAELAALVASFQLDGNGADFGVKSAARRKDARGSKPIAK